MDHRLNLAKHEIHPLNHNNKPFSKLSCDFFSKLFSGHKQRNAQKKISQISENWQPSLESNLMTRVLIAATQRDAWRPTVLTKLIKKLQIHLFHTQRG